MPWKALPYPDRARKQTLSEKFNVTGIPCLIVLSSTCEVLTSEGVAEISASGADAIRRWSQGKVFRSNIKYSVTWKMILHCKQFS
ncbi:unnamed protein product [Adineta steineri]|uniref:Thioredoxin-like protein n=1 Tax=Adineta steineri TaxID=433720 RepID=A0A815YUG4_9BILA|nr:unnamed protein product [Adineta steineri]CAF1671253.1 unnamed protein product [Adineta steineri]